MKISFFYAKKSKAHTLLIVLSLFLIVNIVFYAFNVDYRDTIKQVGTEIFNSFSPNEKLFEDNNDKLFFVGNFNTNLFLGKDKPSLTLPILVNEKENENETSQNFFNLENGIITFNDYKLFTVKSAGIGIVKSVGFLENGLKYVEIKHSGNIVTRYENLKIVGVGTNYNVKPINVIGTLSTEPLIFKILYNNEVVTNFLVEEGKIIWQD